jgi:hypothetical protein
MCRLQDERLALNNISSLLPKYVNSGYFIGLSGALSELYGELDCLFCFCRLLFTHELVFKRLMNYQHLVVNPYWMTSFFSGNSIPQGNTLLF